MNVRGLSTVVATVLILLITLVLVAILAQLLIPFVRDNLQQGTECIPYREYFQFDSSFDYNCYALEGSNFVHQISVKTAYAESSVSEKVAGLALLVKTGGEGKVLTINKGIPESCSLGGVKKLESSCQSLGTINIPNVGEVQSYTYTDKEQIKKMEIAPILKSGKICDVSSSINLIKCNGS